VADRDIPIPIGGEQVTTQPSLLAAMIAALALRGDERVCLRSAPGSAFRAEVLGRLAGEVWSVERRPELAAAASANLASERVGNVHVVAGDGSEGLAAHAPYEAIGVAAAHRRSAPPAAPSAPAHR
jgi:protein-L-isoaspartate(D-aspartate) O-methyltransferase